jgi:hypothetical protein
MFINFTFQNRIKNLKLITIDPRKISENFQAQIKNKNSS